MVMRMMLWARVNVYENDAAFLVFTCATICSAEEYVGTPVDPTAHLVKMDALLMGLIYCRILTLTTDLFHEKKSFAKGPVNPTPFPTTVHQRLLQILVAIPSPTMEKGGFFFWRPTS